MTKTTNIKHIHARQIIDSRGNPTVETEITLEHENCWGRAAVPSGASTGSREAVERRDGDPAWKGKGVMGAVTAVNTIIRQSLVGQCADLTKVDERLLQLDGCSNKENLGANAILSVSMALNVALAQYHKMTLYQLIAEQVGQKQLLLPTPMMNVINGGSHANNSVDFQEFMIIPAGFDRLSDALRCGAEVFQTLKTILDQKKMSTAVGDEGGFAPNLESNEQALEMITMAIEAAGYTAGEQVLLALDVAASEFYRAGKYQLESEGCALDSQDFIEYLSNLCDKYPIVSIEDGLDENDYPGWQLMTEKLGHKIQLVGDDLFVTNAEILAQGVQQKMANAVLVKVNQIGTLSETYQTMKFANASGYNSIISHRSGETEDVFIADLAVGTGCGQIKTGSMSRTDRVAKYNQLLRIEEQLGENALYSGSAPFKK